MNRREFSAALAGLFAARANGRSFVASLLRTEGKGAALDRLTAVPRVNGERLNRHLTELSRFGANPQGGVTRLAYSDADKQAREYVMGLMRDARLAPTIDAAGNIIA